MATEWDNTHFSSLFGPAQVICQTEQCDRDALLMEMLQLLARERGIGDIDEAYRAVTERERDLPTIVAPGMAMPHARLGTIDEIAVAVATSRDGIVYDRARPDSRIKLVVLTLAPKAAPGVYLQAIGCLASICRDPSTADLVASLPTAEQVWSFFEAGGWTT